MTALRARPSDGPELGELEFTLDVHGAGVACFVSEAAIHRWCAELCCERANSQRLQRIAHEVVAAAMPKAAVTAGERWIARVGVDSVALSIGDEH